MTAGALIFMLLLCQQDPSTFGTSRTEVPVVGAPSFKATEVPAAFGMSKSEVPVVGEPGMGLATGWSRASYRAREAEAPAPVASLWAPSMNFVAPSMSTTFLQSTVALASPTPAPAPNDSGAGGHVGHHH